MANAKGHDDPALSLALYRRAKQEIEEAELELRRAQELGRPSPALGRQLQALKEGLLAQQRALVRAHNDTFRRTFKGGRVLQTAGVTALPPSLMAAIHERVQTFAEFTPENDPRGEHDFGAVELEGIKVYWKIDCYDAETRYGSEDPADPALTTRVLTILLPEEY